jgi:hypothetical protein
VGTVFYNVILAWFMAEMYIRMAVLIVNHPFPMMPLDDFKHNFGWVFYFIALLQTYVIIVKYILA